MEVKSSQWAQEGLSADEANGGRDLAEAVDAPSVPYRLHGDPHPDVVGNGLHLGASAMPEDQAISALGENLENVLGRAAHDVEDAIDVLHGDLLMEEVAHAVNEDALGGAPAERELELIGVERDRETVAVAWIPHRLEPSGEALGIAEFAARRDLGAARNRVPRGIGPFNR